MQSKTMSMLALALALTFGSAATHAEELSKSGKPLTAQQSRMKACNADAKAQALKGDERKAFMSTCLKSGNAPAATQASAQPAPVVASATTARQEKRKACSAEAKQNGIKGDERKAFMKECMKRVDKDTADDAE
jgi:hypothetical protein